MTRSAKRGPAGLGPVLWMAGLLAALASLWPETAGAQSFDCRNARSPDEFMVCRDPGLARLDQELATLQRAETDKLPKEARPGFDENAALFLNARRRCGESYRCLEQSYRNRIKEFQDLSTGPGDEAKSGTGTGSSTRRSSRTAETPPTPEPTTPAPATATLAPSPAPAGTLTPPPVAAAPPAPPAASAPPSRASDSATASARPSESTARAEPITPLPPKRT